MDKYPYFLVYFRWMLVNNYLEQLFSCAYLLPISHLRLTICTGGGKKNQQNDVLRFAIAASFGSPFWSILGLHFGGVLGPHFDGFLGLHSDWFRIPILIDFWIPILIYFWIPILVDFGSSFWGCFDDFVDKFIILDHFPFIWGVFWWFRRQIYDSCDSL